VLEGLNPALIVQKRPIPSTGNGLRQTDRIDLSCCYYFYYHHLAAGLKFCIDASLALVNGDVKRGKFCKWPGSLHFSICGVKTGTPQNSQKNGPNREKPAKMGGDGENPLHKWLRQKATTHPRNTARMLRNTATPVRDHRAGAFRVRDFPEK